MKNIGIISIAKKYAVFYPKLCILSRVQTLRASEYLQHRILNDTGIYYKWLCTIFGRTVPFEVELSCQNSALVLEQKIFEV